MRERFQRTTLGRGGGSIITESGQIGLLELFRGLGEELAGVALGRRETESGQTSPLDTVAAIPGALSSTKSGQIGLLAFGAGHQVCLTILTVAYVLSMEHTLREMASRVRISTRGVNMPIQVSKMSRQGEGLRGRWSVSAGLDGWLADGLDGWLADGLAGWLADGLIGGLADGLAGWLAVAG